MGKGGGTRLLPTARLLGIEEYRLPNGLRLVLAPDVAKPAFTVNLTVLVGSVHEGAGEAGMAHVFEHILFHRLEGFPDVKKTFNDLGANCNGNTWFDRTVYFETLNSSDENLETVIRLEAARLGRAELHEEDLEKERRIVESEFELHTNSPQQLMMRGMLGCMYDFHAYSREPIGTLEDFKSVRMENLRAFYKRYYTPDNAALFITGKFDPAKALDLVRTHFGGLKKSRLGRPMYSTREPGAQGERRYVVRAVGDAFEVTVGYRVPGASSPAGAAADVMAIALASDGMGPLHDAVVGKGLASRVYVQPLDLRMPSPWVVSAGVPMEKDPAAAEAAIIDVVEKEACSLAQADVDRAKSMVERYRDQLFNDPHELAEKLSQFEAGGDWKLLFVRCEQIKALTFDDVKAFAARYLRRQNRVVGRFEPDLSAVPVVSDGERPVEQYAEILSRIPAEGKTVKEFSYTPAAMQAALRWVDVGPARIGLLAKEVKGDDVFVTLRIPFAGRAAVSPLRTAGDALGNLMVKRTKSLPKEALEKALAESNSDINAAVSLEGALVAVRTKRDKLDFAMSLASEMLRTPCIEEQEVRELVVRREGTLKALNDNPHLLMGLEISKMLYPPGDHRRKRTSEEQLEELRTLTPETVMAFHKEFFGAERLFGSFVGDVSPEEVTRLVAPFVVPGWKAARPPVQEPNPAVDATTSWLSKVPTPGKPSAFNVLVQPLRMSMRSPDFIPMDVAALALFLDPLSSRIPRKVREEAALSYAVQGQWMAQLDGDFAYIVITAVTSPGNAGASVSLVREELDKALKDGLKAEEFEAAKKSYKNRVALTLSNDSVAGAMIVELGRHGLDFDFMAKQMEVVETLTLDDVNAAVRRYLEPSKMGLIQIGDFPNGA